MFCWRRQDAHILVRRTSCGLLCLFCAFAPFPFTFLLSQTFRVLLWIIKRCEGKIDAKLTPIGYVPNAEDIDIEGLDGITVDTMKELLSVDNAAWLDDVKNIKEFYEFVGDSVPAELKEELAALEERLSK